VLNFPQQADLERALGEPVEARIVLLDPAQPDGYERAWRPAMQFGPERHYGYAVQWFAFAVVALVIFISLSLRRVDAGPSSTSDNIAP
jgi:cytochrome oxidase assembly protein ShyY1